MKNSAGRMRLCVCLLKEQCHEVFDLRFLHKKSKAFVNSASNLRRYSKILV
jgi:hypothetical protein